MSSRPAPCVALYPGAAAAAVQRSRIPAPGSLLGSVTLYAALRAQAAAAWTALCPGVAPQRTSAGQLGAARLWTSTLAAANHHALDKLELEVAQSCASVAKAEARAVEAEAAARTEKAKADARVAEVQAEAAAYVAKAEASARVVQAEADA